MVHYEVGKTAFIDKCTAIASKNFSALVHFQGHSGDIRSHQDQGDLRGSDP